MHLRTVDFAETRKGDKNKTKKKKNKRDRYQRVSHITSQYITIHHIISKNKFKDGLVVLLSIVDS